MTIRPDERLAQRLVDGLLEGPEEQALRERMARDPAFRVLVEDLRRQRDLFARASRAAPPAAAPAGFSSRVAMAARAGLAGGGGWDALATRLSWAAAALLLLSLTVLAGFRLSRETGTLRADDLGRRYEELLRKARSREGARKALVERLREGESLRRERGTPSPGGAPEAGK